MVMLLPHGLESFGTLLKNYSASSLVTPMKFQTVEQIIQTLPVNAAEQASDAASPHTDVNMYREYFKFQVLLH